MFTRMQEDRVWGFDRISSLALDHLALDSLYVREILPSSHSSSSLLSLPPPPSPPLALTFLLPLPPLLFFSYFFFLCF
jgi:hypothetical protein